MENFDEYLRQGEPNQIEKANYEDLSKGIHKTDIYLIRFLSNLLLKGDYNLNHSL